MYENCDSGEGGDGGECGEGMGVVLRWSKKGYRGEGEGVKVR